MSDFASAIRNKVDSALQAADTARAAAFNAAANAIDAANVSVAQINAALTGPANLNFSHVKASLNAPVGPGVVINLPGNTDSELLVNDPLHFQGTINLSDFPGVAPIGLPSYVGLAGVGADHWTFSTGTNTLTLFAGSQVTDTLKLVPNAAGFGVYAASAVGPGLPGGVLLTSPALTTVPSVAVLLPGTIGA
jgi:hypothetical protein